MTLLPMPTRTPPRVGASDNWQSTTAVSCVSNNAPPVPPEPLAVVPARLVHLGPVVRARNSV